MPKNVVQRNGGEQYLKIESSAIVSDRERCPALWVFFEGRQKFSFTFLYTKIVYTSASGIEKFNYQRINK